jgi:hypothetical protein
LSELSPLHGSGISNFQEAGSAAKTPRMLDVLHFVCAILALVFFAAGALLWLRERRLKVWSRLRTSINKYSDSPCSRPCDILPYSTAEFLDPMLLPPNRLQAPPSRFVSMLARSITIGAFFFFVQCSALVALSLLDGTAALSSYADALTIAADAGNDILILIGVNPCDT